MDIMTQWVLNMPEEIKGAVEIFNAFKIPDFSFKNIILLGTGGGSRTTFDLISAFLFDKLKFPLVIHQGYHIPNFVNEETLSIVMSYSGKTEETLSALSHVIGKTKKIIIITSNGEMESISREKSLPVLRVPYGFEARSAIPYLFFPLLLILSSYQNLDVTNEIEETISVLKSERETISFDEIRSVSEKIKGKIPFIYGSYGFSDSLSLRFRRQLAENGKTLSHSNIIPNMHHDEIVGFMDREILPFIIPVFLRDYFEEEKIKKRFDITKEIFEGMGIDCLEIYPLAKGGKLSRMFSMLFKIDLISIDYGKLRGFNPKDVSIISLLKEKMEE